MKTILFVLIGACLSLSCSHVRVSNEETPKSDLDLIEEKMERERDGTVLDSDGKPTVGNAVGGEVTVFSKSVADRLAYASDLSSRGKYDKAIEVYLGVYDDTTADPEHRQETLFALGREYSNLLYPGKDYAKAVSYLEELLSEYPDTVFRPRAEEKIAELKTLLEKVETGK